jgi:hypothetical protein
MEESNYYYRGLHLGHPATADALRGIVRPANPNATISPLRHNLGGYSRRSQFTSWSRYKETAIQFAEGNAQYLGDVGLVLRVSSLPPGPDATWAWVDSPDLREEGEVLMVGFRMDVEVVAP